MFLGTYHNDQIRRAPHAGHVARLEQNGTVVWWEKVKEKDRSKDLGINTITLTF
jgi:hypothetical protein